MTFNHGYFEFICIWNFENQSKRDFKIKSTAISHME